MNRKALIQSKLDWYFNEYTKVTDIAIDAAHRLEVSDEYYFSEKFSNSSDSFFSFHTMFGNLKVDIRLFSEYIYGNHHIVPLSIFYNSETNRYSFHYYSATYRQVVDSRNYILDREYYLRILREHKLKALEINE